MTEYTDAQLGLLLADVGAHVALPETSLAEHLAPKLGRPQRSSLRWVAIAAAVAIFALAVVSIAPAREAIANLLGLGDTTVQRVDQLPASLPTTLPPARGTDAELREELRRARLSAPARTLVGDPVAWHVDAIDETVIVWPKVALTQNHTTDAGVAMKLVPRDAGVVQTTVKGDTALWVPGRHVRTVNGTNFAADSALLWFANSTMYRLETSLSLEQARAVAGSVARVW